MINDRQWTRRYAAGEPSDLSGSRATCDGFCSPTHSWHRRSRWHPHGETASPARTQHVRGPCNLVGSRCVRSRLRRRATANAAGCAVRARATSSWPRSAPQAARLTRAGTMMAARRPGSSPPVRDRRPHNVHVVQRRRRSPCFGRGAGHRCAEPGAAGPALRSRGGSDRAHGSGRDSDVDRGAVAARSGWVSEAVVR
jgi:hypothetical protein